MCLGWDCIPYLDFSQLGEGGASCLTSEVGRQGLWHEVREEKWALHARKEYVGFCRQYRA